MPRVGGEEVDRENRVKQPGPDLPRARDQSPDDQHEADLEKEAAADEKPVSACAIPPKPWWPITRHAEPVQENIRHGRVE